MKNIVVVLLGVLLSSVAMAEPATFVEGAYVFGGENGRNGEGREGGLEFAGSWGINENWYTGGALGYYDGSDGQANTYLNANGGYAIGVSDKTSVNFEGGLWFGHQSNQSAPSNDPRAIEAKVGVNHQLADKFSVFGTMAIVHADLDTPTNDDLSNFIYSIGGAYAFTDAFSLNVKMVNGVNGVNGQDEVLRIAGRFSF
jgi:hypothetical protein